ncbi:hypothetical protein GCM10022207_84420 [Streptomyces lannensis]|uniref:Acetyltransferase n=1 Tax=Streptomyces lannensis TaxID=766498 RepID=A0ABP7LMM9_9ACTN
MRVDLSIRVEDALTEMPPEGRQEILETIAAVLVRRDAWPRPGGWEAARSFAPRSWMAFSAYLDGIDVGYVG